MNNVTFSEWAAYWILKAAQYTPFRGTGSYSDSSRQALAVERFPQAVAEAARFSDFFSFFKGLTPKLRDRNILDLGSGYGGRTIEYRRTCGAAKVVGVEPYRAMVEKSIAYMRAQGMDGCEFRTCEPIGIPAGDGEFDVIVSYDVIEHVHDPVATIQEMWRVLTPGGEAYIVFTPYWGAFSHHLNYITRLPFIHWVFDAGTLVKAVNRILASDYGKRFGTAQQPAPQLSFNRRFTVLPTINGIEGDEFLTLARQNGFAIVHHRYVSLAEQFLPAPLKEVGQRLNELLMATHPKVKEAFSFNLVCVLRKDLPAIAPATRKRNTMDSNVLNHKGPWDSVVR